MTDSQKHTAIIAEDELPIREQLQELLASDQDFSLLGTATNGTDLKKLLKKGPDLALLDIDLPIRNTMDVIAEQDQLPHIIFITAYENYAVQAFEIGAVDYLLKPISEERFLKALQKSKESIRFSKTNPESETIWVKRDSFIYPIQLAEITHLESKNKTTIIHTRNGQFVTPRTLSRLHATLDQNTFIRVHRSFVANTNFIQSLGTARTGNHTLLMITGRKLPVGRTYYKNAGVNLKSAES